MLLFLIIFNLNKILICQILAYFQKSKGHPRLTKEFSLKEFSQCYGGFRYEFREELAKPSQYNNSIITYDMKCRDFVVMNSSFFMIVSGVGTMTFKRFFGHSIDSACLNYLG